MKLIKIICIVGSIITFSVNTNAASPQDSSQYCDIVINSPIASKLETIYEDLISETAIFSELSNNLDVTREYLDKRSTEAPQIYDGLYTEYYDVSYSLNDTIDDVYAKLDQLFAFGIEDQTGRVMGKTMELLMKAVGMTTDPRPENYNKLTQLENILPQYTSWFDDCAQQLKDSSKIYIFILPSKKDAYLSSDNPRGYLDAVLGYPSFDPFMKKSMNPQWITPFYFAMNDANKLLVENEINFNSIELKADALLSLIQESSNQISQNYSQFAESLNAADDELKELLLANEKKKEEELERQRLAQIEAEKRKEEEERLQKKREEAFRKLQEYRNSPQGRLENIYINYQIIKHCYELRTDKAVQFITRQQFNDTRDMMKEFEKEFGKTIDKDTRDNLWEKAFNNNIKFQTIIGTTINRFDYITQTNISDVMTAKQECDFSYSEFLSYEKAILGEKVISKDF